MKKIIIVVVCALVSINALTQTIFLRHDTAILKASECNWLIPPSLKQAPSKSAQTIPVIVTGNENTVSEWFLAAIGKGKLKAFDPVSDERIPAKEIYNWQMPRDTMAVFNENGDISQYKVVIQELDPQSIKRITIQQDWWLDNLTGKIFSRVRWIELMTEVYSFSGEIRGYKSFCRIKY
jgi:hypothetical protein